MDRSEATLRKLFAALPAPGYDIGVLSDDGMYRVEAAPDLRVLRMLPYLKYRNANGAHIYLRPTGESPYTLLDDLTPAALSRLAARGFQPAAVVETSPGSFQAWLRHEQPLSRSSEPSLQRYLQNGSVLIAARQIGAGSGALPASPTASRNTAAKMGCFHSPIYAAHRARPSPPPLRSILICSPCNIRPNRNEPPHVAASPLVRFVSRPLPCRASVRRSGIRSVPRLLTWPSALPLVLRGGRSPSSPPHSAAIIFLATPARRAKPPISNERFPKPFAGRPKTNRGRIPFGFSPPSFRLIDTLRPEHVPRPFPPRTPPLVSRPTDKPSFGPTDGLTF